MRDWQWHFHASGKCAADELFRELPEFLFLLYPGCLLSEVLESHLTIGQKWGRCARGEEIGRGSKSGDEMPAAKLPVSLRARWDEEDKSAPKTHVAVP